MTLRDGSPQHQTPLSASEVERLVDQYADLVLRLAFTYLGQRADAEDMVQTVFLKAMTAAPQFRDEGHEKAWFIRVTANACKDALRARSRRAVPVEYADEVPDREPDGSESAIGGLDAFPGEASPVTAAVLELAPEYREVIFLYYYEGYSTREIADLLSCSDDVVRTRLSRARKKIRQRLERGDHD